MPLVPFVSDSDFLECIRQVILVADKAIKDADTNFGKNVIDPFAALFEVSSFRLDHSSWKKSEQKRQTQKTLQNAIGSFHQKLLGCVTGWENLPTGQDVDLRCTERKIIAEVKNKHNTVKKSDLAGMYEHFERLVMPKASIYKGFTAYLVSIIPKTPERFEKLFTPSARNTGNTHSANQLIKEVDGATFYKIVTGRQNALQEMYDAMPTAIEKVLSEKEGMPYQLPNKDELRKYFFAAYTSHS